MDRFEDGCLTAVIRSNQQVDPAQARHLEMVEAAIALYLD